MKKLLLLPLSLLVLLSSCSLQKRSYQPGYYISWHKSSTDPKISAKENAVIHKIECMQRVETTVSSTHNSLEPKMSVIKVSATRSAGNCDTLILQNGTEVKAKIIEINQTEVRYKYCNNPDGPTIVVAKKDVRLIKYANGEKEQFTPEKTTPSPLSNGQMIKDKYIQKQAQTALICGLISFLVLYFGIITATIAIIKGSRALRLIGKDKDQYHLFYNEAKTGLTLGIVYFCLLVFLLILILLIAVAAGLI